KSYSAEDVHHYIMTLRKRPANRLPRWEAWGDGCARMPGIAYSLLSASERKDLTEVYKVLAARTEVGSDSILVNPAHRRELARLFAARTGRGINDRDLIAALIDLRKEGLLPTVGDLPRPTKRRRKFDDFDQAEGMA
ncbi:MAG: hypothetical protein K2X42_07205, partial [Burkholderiaceae bacterium]|nr:hypothetical protein [Burkholderiaceae bacterium]